MGSQEPLDFARLGEYLRALSYESRLELLYILRYPRLLQDIRLPPRQLKPGENPDRAVARQTVQTHLDKLVEIGVVVVREAQEEGRRGKEYVVNPQRLFLVMEEFRKVGTITANTPPPRGETMNLPGPDAPVMEPGPKLLLVHGLVEAKVFPLRSAGLKDGRGWIIGRKPGLHVSLEYDPFVSTENSEILPDGQQLLLMDLRTSKNGTWLNWRRLDLEDRVPLTPGDILGVGRSTLVYRGV